MNRIHTEFKNSSSILNGKTLAEFGTELKKIKSLDEEKISDEPKWNRIKAKLENSPLILNGKNFAEFGTELKK